jgi:polysaccharide biosynthesis protein PslG
MPTRTSRRRHQAIFITVAALAVALVVSSASAAVPKNFFAVVEGGPLHGNDPATMKNTGVSSYRFAVRWSLVNRSKGNFDWSATDNTVSQLAAGGITPFPFLYGTPTWLSSDPGAAPLSGAKKTAWVAFLKNAVRRYGPNGSYWSGGANSPFHRQCGCSKDPKPIRAWQIWNEANYVNYWQGKPSAKEYGHLVKISHKAIASVDRRAKIVLAGLKPVKHSTKNTSWNFLSSMYQVRGIKKAFDATALHPYPSNITELKTAIRKFHAAQRKHHDGDTPLWLTEHGWGSGDPSLSHLNKGLQGQKRLLKRSFKLILHNRKRWSIGRVFWFSWRDGGSFATGSCDFCKSAGLLKADGSPKPSYFAYRSFAK